MGDLIVTDKDYEEYQDAVKSYGNALEDRLYDYLAIMRRARSTAIIDGTVGKRLDAFIDSTQSLLKETVRIQTLAAGLCMGHFVEDIDEADRMLY